MDTQEYCNNLCNELIRWRNEVHKENEKMSHVPSADKQHMLGFVEDLIMLEAEMDDRIEQLKNECPTVWQPEHAEDVIEPGGSITKFAVDPKDTDKYMGGGDYGG